MRIITKLVSATLLSIALLTITAYGQANAIAKVEPGEKIWDEQSTPLGEHQLKIEFTSGVITVGSGGGTSLETTNTPSITLTEVYRVGVGDVLDVQLSGLPSSQSTLFTVLEDGLLDYPFAGEAVKVSGLTTSEIGSRLRERIKVFENPEIVVSVRDYASHSVMIKGFVGAPGRRALRREAIPLFVVLAEAQQLPEATRATIIRGGSQPQTVSLSDKDGSSTLVYSGDVISVEGLPVEELFFFIGGKISSPGQRPYHKGLTLTQAILASGGVTAGAGRIVRVSRQSIDGRLITTEYNLKEVTAGQIPDPSLNQGDRLEVSEDQ